MDGRKNNGAKKGVSLGQGRKPKAEEIAMIENMDATKAPIEVWQKLAEKVDSGDTQAIKCWLEYRYGKPKQLIAIENNDENSSVPVITWATKNNGTKSGI